MTNPIDYQILKYAFWDYFKFKYKLMSAKKNESYKKVSDCLLRLQKHPESFHDRPISDCTFTVFDLETTGFLPELGDEVVSIGAVKVKGYNLSQKESLYSIIKPLQKVSKQTKDFTGLTKRDLKNGKCFTEGLNEFLAFSKGTILVAHPATFDINFLKVLIRRWGLPSYDPEFLDSYSIANWLLETDKNYLDSLVEKYNVKKRDRHHALNDALMTAEIFIHLLEGCSTQSVKSINSLKKRSS
jgi:DNA polymerase III subunit epsilon